MVEAVQLKSEPVNHRRLTKFTPERIQQILNLVERGISPDEIAEIVGVTIGTLQINCSKMGISLKRPKIDNGVDLLRKRTPLRENTSHHRSDHDGRMPLQTTEEQLHRRSQSQPSEPAEIVKPQQEQAATPGACSATFAIRFHYRGIERTAELPLTTHTVGQLAFEAALRDMELGELIAEIITAMLNKDPLGPDNIDPEP
jgi:hypothetical protein